MAIDCQDGTPTADRSGFLDSGCTVSIFQKINMFVQYERSSRRVGSAISSMSLNAEGEGTVSLPVRARDGSIVHLVMPALH
jgi:hypothetical protein